MLFILILSNLLEFIGFIPHNMRIQTSRYIKHSYAYVWWFYISCLQSLFTTTKTYQENVVNRQKYWICSILNWGFIQSVHNEIKTNCYCRFQALTTSTLCICCSPCVRLYIHCSKAAGFMGRTYIYCCHKKQWHMYIAIFITMIYICVCERNNI